MSTYRLKDKNLQAKLQSVFPWFYDCLQQKFRCSQSSGWFEEVTLRENDYSVGIVIPKNLIEIVPEYKPKKWNNWSLVSPPQYERMRLTVTFHSPQENGAKEYAGCALFNGSVWIDVNTKKKINLDRQLDTVMFRPWE